MDIAEAIIISKRRHFVMPLPAFLPDSGIAGNSMISESAQFLREVEIIGRHHSAFACGNVLHGMKTEDCHMTKSTNASALVTGSERMTGVFDQDQPVPLSRFQQREEVNRVSGIIHWQQRSGARIDFVLNRD